MATHEAAGFQILLNFVPVKQFHSQIGHVISSLLNFPVILSPQVFMLPPIYFWTCSLRTVGRHRALYQAPCTLMLSVGTQHEKIELATKMTLVGELWWVSKGELTFGREKCHSGVRSSFQWLLERGWCKHSNTLLTFPARCPVSSCETKLT